MSINTTKTALENLYDLIGTANGKLATPDHFTVGPATVRTPDVHPHNTSVFCSAVQGGGFDGDQTFYYSRLDLDDLAPDLEYRTTESTTLADVKAWAITQLGVISAEVEFQISVLPTIDEDGELVELFAKAGSYTYIGSKLITLLPPLPTIPSLADAFPVTDLNGFEAA